MCIYFGSASSTTEWGTYPVASASFRVLIGCEALTAVVKASTTWPDIWIQGETVVVLCAFVFVFVFVCVCARAGACTACFLVN